MLKLKSRKKTRVKRKVQVRSAKIKERIRKKVASKKKVAFKLTKLVVGFKIYRDQSGRFIGKAIWENLLKNKRGAASVEIKRDAKGRFVSEKFFPPSVDVKKEKVKSKEKCPPSVYRNVHETIIIGVVGHYNVTGIENLSYVCLARLIDHQQKRGAVRFRFWYDAPPGTQSSQEFGGSGTASTEPFWLTRFQGEGGTLGFLKRFGQDITQYWFRTKDYKATHAMSEHGVLSYRSK